MSAKIKSEVQLSFGDEDFAHPDAPSREKQPRKSAAKPVKNTKSGSPASLQAYLPGLSRRGRPRVKNPVAPTVRASESRKRRIAAGGKRIELVLEPAVAAGLEALMRHHKSTRVEIIARLIARAAKRLVRN